MYYLDAFYAEDVETQDRFGTIVICEMPKKPEFFAYYFKSLGGEYAMLYELGSKSVQECREFEETKLKDLIDEHISGLKVKDWRIYRTRPTIWDDASLISPEISNRSFLYAKMYLFEEDKEA